MIPYDESKHLRYPKGHPLAGKFRSKGGSSAKKKTGLQRIARRKKVMEYLAKEKEKIAPKLADKGLWERAQRRDLYAGDALGKLRGRSLRLEEATKRLKKQRRKEDLDQIRQIVRRMQGAKGKKLTAKQKKYLSRLERFSRKRTEQ